jgi:uncharacterized LabA/DUF88 family protein
MANRTMIFIDGGYVRDKLINVYKRPWNWDISGFNVNIHFYFFQYTPQGEEHIRTYYYDGIYDSDDPNLKPEHRTKLTESRAIFNAFNHMEQVEVVLEKLIVSGKGETRQKGVDTRVAIDMITKAQLDHYDIAILFCGDRDFIPIVRAVKTFTGKRVNGVYFEGHCPDELIALYDRVHTIREQISKYGM